SPVHHRPLSHLVPHVVRSSLVRRRRRQLSRRRKEPAPHATRPLASRRAHRTPRSANEEVLSASHRLIQEPNRRNSQDNRLGHGPGQLFRRFSPSITRPPERQRAFSASQRSSATSPLRRCQRPPRTPRDARTLRSKIPIKRHDRQPLEQGIKSKSRRPAR